MPLLIREVDLSTTEKLQSAKAQLVGFDETNRGVLYLEREDVHKYLVCEGNAEYFECIGVRHKSRKLIQDAEYQRCGSCWYHIESKPIEQEQPSKL